MPLTASAPLETAPAILEIGLLLLLAVAAGWVARRFGLPAVIGYLVVGLIVSPFTPGYVVDRRQLQVLADVGVVVLLFEVGIEIDPVRLIRNRSAVLWTAPVQVLVTTFIVGAATFTTAVSMRISDMPSEHAARTRPGRRVTPRSSTPWTCWQAASARVTC